MQAERTEQGTANNDRQRPSTTVNETPRKATEDDEIDKVEGIRTNKEILPIGSTKKAAPAFRPPTVDEVKAYCLERKNSVDPVRFVDYYTSNGWKVGKNPMKDWKAAVRTWERSEPKQGRMSSRQQDYYDKWHPECERHGKSSVARIEDIELKLEDLE